MNNDRINTILLVEDDLVDVMTTQRAFRELEIAEELVVKGNGEEALEYLRAEGTPMPDFVLLDINMPRMNGIEFLKIVKEDDRLKRVPIIILTTSKEDQDRFESFQTGVAGYIIKPVNYQKFVAAIDQVYTYWKLSELPDH